MTETLCPFPIHADRVCGRTVAQRSGPGRPRVYCDDPKHNAVARLRADRRFRARTHQDSDAEPQRPVTERVSALAAALDRLGDLKAELLAELADAEELAADVADLDLVAAEMRAVEAAADARVALALAAQAAAERDAAQARRERDEAVELSEIACDAAEEAIAGRDEAVEAVTRMREDCDRDVARVSAVADAELAKIDAALVEARADRDRITRVAESALAEVRAHCADNHRLVDAIGARSPVRQHRARATGQRRRAARRAA
ncbi:hypothetical protein ACQPW1_00260 [Nocardia sp. CA-128927]|uniref:hypothetical protein n=1 Tax=Nocardia sp. CA-128927 TaxID=3239975 RepID=UPI003D96A238